MKQNILLLSLAVFFLLPSCKKVNDPLLAEPDVRLNALLDTYQNSLISSASGWKGYVWTGSGGGYSFYFNFDNKNGVSMTSDLDTTTAIVAKNSTYRLKALQQPSLIFDTYNYIHKLTDPNPEVMGGVRNKGLTSDIEFAFLTSAADSVNLQGLANKTPLTLLKATVEEAAQYNNGQIKQLLKATDNFIKSSPYLYLQFSDGKKIQLAFSGKKIILSYINNGTEVVTLNSDFCYTLKGILLKNTLNYVGNQFDQLLWDDNLKRYYVVINNTRTDVLPSPTPIIPFYMKFGAGKDYSLITVNVPTLTGLSADFLSVYNTAKAGLAALSGRVLNYFSITFNGAEDMTLKVNYTNTAGTVFTATFLYKMTWTGLDKVNFTFISRDNNANTAGPGVVALTNYLEQNQFLLDWFANNTPGSSSVLGGMKKVANPDSYFFGVLSK